MTATSIVAYLALFGGAGFAFLLINLLIGRLVRPDRPNAEKVDIYECGEPTIGSSFVQFDLRFYVVALLFLIFDVEVALFFPWATVFGKATQLASPQLAAVDAELTNNIPLTEAKLRELGIPEAAIASGTIGDHASIEGAAQRLALMGLCDILVFFAVLLVGFAYVWRRGDIDWVRAVSHERRAQRRPPDDVPQEQEAVMAGS